MASSSPSASDRVRRAGAVVSGELPLAAATLVGLAVVAVAGLLLAELFDAVLAGDEIDRFDPLVVDAAVVSRTPGWTAFFRGVTRLADGPVVVAVVLVASGLLLIARRVRLAGFVVLSSVGAAAATWVAKLGVDRPRPPEAIHLVEATGAAFPSGHATQSIACWGALATVGFVLVRGRGDDPVAGCGAVGRSDVVLVVRSVLVALALVVALAVGASRVYLGVHWPSDVLAGWSVAALWVATLLLVGWAQPRWRRSWRRHPAVGVAAPRPVEGPDGTLP